MGAIQSLAKENSTLKRYAEYTREQADSLTNRYKALDLEFGLDMDSLAQLLEDETTAAEAMTCFGRGNGTVNALEILVAVCMTAQGTEAEALRSMFVIFDFGGIGSTSYDEFAILCLVAARVLVLVAKADTKSEPSDQLIDQIVRQKFAPTDRVELEQCMTFCNEIFPVDETSKQRTLETLLKPFEIPLPLDSAAELGALLGVTTATAEGGEEGKIVSEGDTTKSEVVVAEDTEVAAVDTAVEDATAPVAEVKVVTEEAVVEPAAEAVVEPAAEAEAEAEAGTPVETTEPKAEEEAVAATPDAE